MMVLTFLVSSSKCNAILILHVNLGGALACALGDPRPCPWTSVMDHCEVWFGCDKRADESIDEQIGCCDLLGPSGLAGLRSGIHDQHNVQRLVALQHL